MNPVWTEPPAEPVAGKGTVHIWFRDFQGVTDFGRAIESLSADERARAGRFSNEESRLTYLGSHIFLRHILAKYLRTEPTLVRFDVDRNGKPRVINPAIPGLEFNLSHSHLAAACAITVAARIGIDLEHIDPLLCDETTADQVLSPSEMHQLANFKTQDRCDAFFRGWTRKEAYAKCLGLGMSAALKIVDLGFADSDATLEGFAVSTFTCPNHYVASVAVEGKPAVMKFWDLTTRDRSAGAL